MNTRARFPKLINHRFWLTWLLSLALILQPAIPAVARANDPTPPSPDSQPPTPPSFAQSNADLAVTALNTSGVVTDSQKLTLAGELGVTLRNLGSAPVNTQFRVIAFEDRNANARFDAGADVLLGSTDFQGGVAADANANLGLSLSGTVTFKGNLIYVLADSDNTVQESNENNNLRHTGQNSSFAQPPAGRLTPTLKWSWTGSSVEPNYRQVIVTPMVANLNDDNGDGKVDAGDTPDIVFATTNRLDGGLCGATDGLLRAISGRDGSPLFDITNSMHRVQPCAPAAIGDLDGDRLPEIVAVQPNRLVIFGNDGSFKAFTQSANTGGIPLSGPSIADLDGDGSAEIIDGATVWNKEGQIIFSRPDNGNGFGPLSTVANLDLGGNPEIVSGFRAYKSDGTLFYDLQRGDGYPAIGNFDADQNPEVVVVQNGSVFLLEHNGALKWGPASIGGGRGGPPTVADFDGDRQPEIGVAGAGFYSVFETDGALKWRKPISDTSSNVTGSSVFDFDGDGNAEVVYSDEFRLRIFRGTDGEVLFETLNPSCTATENPVIADVDNDGRAEIVVARNQICGFAGQVGITNSGIFVYGDRSWTSTRRIWNQHSYHITNVNEDGTIPRFERPNWLEPGLNNFRLNTFAPGEGIATPAPDLIPSFIRKNDTLFPASVELTARVGNGGSAAAEGQAVGTNLIQNGGFENASIDPGSGFLRVPAGETSITNWLVTKGDVHYMGTFWQQADGDRSVDMDGLEAGGLEQNITTVPGNTYQVRFALAGNPGAGPTIKPMRVSAAGQSQVFNFDITGKTFQDMGWEQRTWTFTANSSTTPLRFESLTDTGSIQGWGPALDSVEVRQLLSSGGRFSVAFYRGDPAAGGALIGTARSTKSLAPGEFEDVKVAWNNPPAGLHQIFVVADDDGAGRGVVNEGNETNNKAFANFLLGGTEQMLVDDLIARFKDGIVDLKWTPIPGAASYNIYRRAGAQPAQLIKSGHLTSYANFPDSGLTNGTTYYYTVRWVDAGGKESGDGTEISATPTSVANRNAGDVPPTILSAPVTRARANQPYSYQARALDPDPGERLTWSLTAPPSGMTIDAGTGLIQWTPALAQAGYVSVQARVVDSRGRFATQTYRLLVEAVNQAPLVDAGPDQTLTLPGSANLNGRVSDDGLPDGGTMTVSWSRVSGPGTVTFADPASPATTAAFSATGTYVLRLTASDSLLASHDEVTVTVIRLIASRLYTLDADFDEGALSNVEHRIPNQLQLGEKATPFNFIWVAVSSKGTVVKIDTATGRVLGEYRTAPQGQPTNPSRTTVDLNGNVWVANRNGNSVARIGLRENGQCVDRNGNGRIDTSTGLNDLKPWTNAGGADTGGGVSTAQDECAINYVRVSSSGTRHLSIDRNNDVWVSGVLSGNPRVFNLIDGGTAAIKRTEGPVGYGGYGGLMDPNGVIWSAGLNNLLRWDVSKPLSGPNGVNWRGYDFGGNGGYGLAIDGQGFVWNTNYDTGQVRKFAPDGTLTGTFRVGAANTKGCAVDRNGHVWIAHAENSSTVGHLKNDGTLVGNVTVGSGPTGVAVDAAGKIWATNFNSRTVSRIDPNAGPIGADGVTRVGAVDFTTVDLGGTLYNYSDMTGSTLVGAPQSGTWTVVFDSKLPQAEWGRIIWNAQVCNDGSLTITAETSENGSAFSPAQMVTRGADLTVPNGRYLKVTVLFKRASTGESPILYDLFAGTEGAEPPAQTNAAPAVNAGPDQTVSLPNPAQLKASVCDDGLPAGRPVAVSWNRVSGPGTVTFSNPDRVTTTASFSAPGNYVLRLSASDSELGASDDVAITVIQPNQAPVVNAGPDQSIALPNAATLNGAVTDDGLPAGGMLTIAWSRVSGPGTVTFNNPNSAATTATFSAAGVYVLRLTASDSQLSASDDVTITVAPQNQAPVVNAGPDQTITLPTNSLTLNGTATDDGLPAGSRLTIAWSRVSGPGTVAFGNPAAARTTASFSAAGVYVLRLSATDGQLTSSDDVTVTVIPQNQAPAVNAGPDQTITLPTNSVTLNGTVTDDGLPAGGRLTIAWSRVSGPGTVTFGTPNSAATTATFSAAGTYVLRLTANDSQLSASDDVTVTVIPQNRAPVVNAGPDQTILPPSLRATLNGTVTDDGLPPGSRLTIAWSRVSGPGTVTFANPAAPATTATFSATGVYVLRLTASDSQLSTQDDVTITVVAQIISRLYTLDADFDEGSLSNVDHRIPNQLQLSEQATPFNFIWVAVTFQATIGQLDGQVVKINTDTGQILGVYRTAPEGQPTDPSRTTVDLNGNVWVSNRAGNSVARIGLLENGQCVDRNGNGRIDTSTGQRLRWPNTNRADEFGGVSNAEDECIINYTRTGASGTRHLSVNQDNDVWVSGYRSTLAGLFQLLDGRTGTIKPGFGGRVGYGGYGGLIDKNGVLWSASLSGLLRWDTSKPLSGPNGGNWRGYDFVGNGSYGLGIDPQGFVWNTNHDTGQIRKFAPDGTLAGTFAGGATRAQGCAVDRNGHVWIAHSQELSTVGHLKNDGSFVGNVRVGNGPTGVAVDARGKIWVTNWVSGTVSRIDPNAGPIGADGVTRVGAVDFTTGSFGGCEGGFPVGCPYNYSDMTGSTLTGAPLSGTWTVVFDNKMPQAEWGRIIWNAQVCNDGSLSVTAASSENGSTFSPAQTVTRGADLTVPNGRYLKVTAIFKRASTGESPILYDLSVGTVAFTPPAQTNAAPAVNAGADQTISLPNTAQLKATVCDDDLPIGKPVTVSWSRVSGPGTVGFSNPDRPATTASFSAPGSYVLRLTASDSELTRTDDVTITVVSLNRPPVVNAGPDQTITLPTNRVTLNGTVTDDGVPAGGALTIAWSKVSGPDGVTFGTPNAAVTTATFTLVGTYVLRLTASDSQLAASDDVTITVRASTPPPTVALTAPADGADITTRTEVRGSVNFNNQPGGSWKLEYSPFTADSSFVLTWITFATGTTAVNNGVLGALDPTLLLNGIHAIRLTATDAVGQSAAVMTTVIVSGQQKVGHFTLSFNDLSVPLPGLPIQVIRTYDSRDKRVGDFGVGWTLSLRDVRLEKTDNLGLHWRATTSGGPFPNYCLEPTRPLNVTITFPDNRVYKFQAATTPRCQALVPIQSGTLGFTQLPGLSGTAGARLDVVGNNAFLVNGAVGGPVTLIDTDTINVINPTQFRLTTAEGFVYVIDQTAGVQSIAEPNGNTITINANGITHSNGQRVAFVRDAQGRITQITDPAGNPLRYSYDANGDLVSFTDRENNATTFTYNSNHYLLTIKDPLGRTPIRNDYDANGRLIKHTDAFGKMIAYTHDLNARQEVIADRNGAVRLLEYDAQGNVVRETDPNGKVMRRGFDARGNRTCETDSHEPAQIAATCEASPRRTLYTYDAQDNLLSLTDPLGNRTEYTYNSRRQVLATKDPRGKVTTNVYDGKNNLTSTTDAGGNATTYTYDAQGNVKSQTVQVDGIDQVTRYDYDARGNLTKETDALGNETTYTYDANGNRLTQTAKRTVGGAVETLTTTYVYDKLSRLTQTTDPDGTVTRTVYDELSRQKETFDKLDRKTSFSYDEMGRLVKTIYPDTTFEESSYDNEGRRLTSKDRGGRTTTYEYDGLGRLTGTTYPDATFTRNVYDAAGRLVRTIDARGKATSYEYDSAGRRTKVKDPLGNETVFSYDANGNQASVKDPKGNTTAFEYDDLSRRVKTIFPDTTFSTTSYDSLGRRRGETDQANVTTRFEYDKLSRLTKVIDALSKETTYAYDELGNRLTQTDANNHTTRFEYDKLGRQTKRILPGNASETLSYDAAGNLKSRTDFIGRITNYDYDVNNRLTMRKYPDNTAFTFTYTATGRRATAVDARGATSYVYDSRDRLVSLSYPDGRKLEYGYDGNGNRTSLTARIGSTVLTTSYAYDDASRLDLVTDPLNRAYDHGYDANGNRASLAYPNGTTTSYSYNTLNRLTNLATTHPASGRTIQSYAFTLGAAGNRTKITEQDGMVRDYTYDALYRLTNEKVTVSGAVSYEKAFTYDNVGNRQRQTTTGQGAGTINYTYDDRDRLLTENATTYGYDNNGNLTSKSGEATYAWDFDNRLIRVETGPAASRTITEHAYDADGNRVQTKVTPLTGPPTVTNFLVDTSELLSHVVAETDGAGNLKAYYVRGDDLLTVMRPNGTGGYTSRFYHADGLGSIRRLTDEVGNITDSYTYTSFGELLARNGTDPQPYQFAGEPFDPIIGFYYNRSRWMDPKLGRFLGMDPFGGRSEDPISLHRYLYTNVNPINNVDPSGRFTLTFGLSVSLSGILSASGVVSAGAVAGAFLGAIDAYIGGADVRDAAIRGGVIGGLTAPLAGVRILRAVLAGVGIGVSSVGAYQAWLDEDYELAAFRGGLALAGSILTWRFYYFNNVRNINPGSLRWTQRTAGGNGRAQALRASMAKNGWEGPPIDVVETPDGLVTVDHTRAAVAMEQGIGSIPVRVHQPSDPLPSSMPAERFPGATTWGEAILVRAGGQNPPLPPTGTTAPPRLPPNR